jgi:hypothetical protein
VVGGVTASGTRSSLKVGTVAAEAARYLDAVDLFSSLGADPHAAARIRAARARQYENQTLQTACTGARRGVRRWTR